MLCCAFADRRVFGKGEGVYNKYDAASRSVQAPERQPAPPAYIRHMRYMRKVRHPLLAWAAPARWLTQRDSGTCACLTLKWPPAVQPILTRSVISSRPGTCFSVQLGWHCSSAGTGKRPTRA